MVQSNETTPLQNGENAENIENVENGVPPSDASGMRLKLEANDGTVIVVDEDVACKSRLISEMLRDLNIADANDTRLNDPLPVTNVDGKTLRKILEYCELKRATTYKVKDEKEDPRIILTPEDEEYMNVPSEELLQILLGANYLDIPEIIDITTQKIANMAIGKTVEELREIYGLENDFTPDEEEELRQRFAWVEL